MIRILAVIKEQEPSRAHPASRQLPLIVESGPPAITALFGLHRASLGPPHQGKFLSLYWEVAHRIQIGLLRERFRKLPSPWGEESLTKRALRESIADTTIETACHI